MSNNLTQLNVFYLKCHYVSACSLCNHCLPCFTVQYGV